MGKLATLLAALCLLLPSVAFGQAVPEQFSAWGKHAKSDPYLGDPGLDGPGTADVKATEAEKAQGFVVFARPVTALVKPDYVPTAEDRCTALSAEDCRGQYGPVSFCVFALQKGDFAVTVSDLAGPGGAKIPAANFDIRAARYIKATSKIGDKDVTETFPVLLESFDKKPLPEKRLQQFWITYCIPKDAAPGVYHGEVRISADGKQKLALPLKLKVLKFDLADPGMIFYLVYHPPEGKDGVNFSLLTKQLTDQKCHNMTMACGSPAIDKDGNLKAKELTDLLDLYAKFFPKGSYYAQVCNRITAEWLSKPDESIKMYGQWYRFYPFTKERDEHYVQVVRTISQECKKRGMSMIMEVANEPGSHPWTHEGTQHYLALVKKEVPEVIRQETCGGGWAMDYPEDQLWKGLLDIWTTNRWLPDKLDIVRKENPTSQIHIYNMGGGGSQAGGIAAARNVYGYFNWKAKVTGVRQWVYQSQPVSTYAWPSSQDGEGNVPTLRWEMVREGVKDRRLVATLEKLVAMKRQNELGRISQRVGDAETLLKEISGKIELANTDYDPISGGRVPCPSPETFDQWRARLIALIEGLSN